MFNSLKKKIIAVIMSIAIFYTIVFMGISYYAVTRAVENQMKNDGATLIVGVSRQIKDLSLSEKGKIVGVFKHLVESSKGNIVYISIADKDMRLLASSDEKASGTNESNQQDAVSSASQSDNAVEEVTRDGEAIGFIFKTPEGEKVYNVSIPFYEVAKEVGTINVGISLSDMNKLIFKGMIEIAIVALIILIISIIGAVLISKGLTKPIKSITSNLNDFAKGNFTIEFKTNSRDEVGRLTEGLNSTVKVLRETLEGIKRTAEGLNQVSNELTSAGENAAESSQVVSGAVNEVFKGANEQTIHISEVAERFEEFSQALDDIQTKSQEVVGSSKRIKGSADNGSERLRTLITSIAEVKTEFGIAENRIHALGSDVGKIGEITDVINQVAQQTNLLALNAAIESARAGEAGRGFAVVADEIRKLAEQVMDSSKSINSLIEAVKSSTDNVTTNTGLISEKINTQVVILENTVLSFNDIEKEVDNSLVQMKEAYELIENTVKEKENIVRSVESLSGISEEVSTSAGQISASAEAQSDSVKAVYKVAQDVNAMANNLTEHISKFKV